MSSHRADKRSTRPAPATPRSRSSRGTQTRSAMGPAALGTSASTGPGRRRATKSSSKKASPSGTRSGRGLGLSISSLIGGGALIAAAIGAATAGEAISSGTTPTASHTRGNYVANLSSASLEGRDATQVSRSGARPIVATGQTPTTAVERQAQARVNLLRSAANDAQAYAKELSSDEWVLPTTGFHISVWFGESGGYWSSGYHTGIDFATAYGTPVVAVGNATVVQTGWDGPYGNQIRLQFDNGDQVWYNHLSAIEVTTGQTVVKGQEIGRVGDTGNAYGYHLHFEYRLASDLHNGIDPVPYFLEHGITLR